MIQGFRQALGFRAKKKKQDSGSQASPPVGRASYDSSNNIFFGNSWVVTSPIDSESFWRLNDIDTTNLDSYTPMELLDMLIDLSPDVSYAVWHFQRLCNPGFDYKVYTPGTKEVAQDGQAYIASFFEQLRTLYGSVDVVFGRFFLGAYLRGAFCGELVFGPDQRTAIDLASPDPFSIRFRRRQDPLRKQVWEPGQWQLNEFVSLEIPTFRYVPVDPAPASPYGRPLASPALFTAIFMLSVWHDVKRVIMQQGYKRMDIVLNTEQAMESFTFDPQGKENLGQYMQAAIDAVKSVYRTLQPDDAFIHTDLFTLGSPVGTVDSDSIGAIDKIIERLEKTVTRALKSNGVVQDTGDNSNETDSNRKWEIHAAGIKSLQHHCENMLESLFNLALQAQGIQGTTEFRFAELRASEMFRDEQTKQLRIQNSRDLYDAGYVSQDEAANYAINHSADEKEPRYIRTSESKQDNPTQPTVQDNNSGNEDLSKKQDNKDSTNSVQTIDTREILNYVNRNNGTKVNS